jgi:PAS domain S-box-containing protein
MTAHPHDTTKSSALAPWPHDPILADEDYRAIFEITSEGVIILDTDSRILAVNRAGCEVFGFAPEDLIGENFSILLPPEHRQYHDRMVHGSSIETPRIVNHNRTLKGLRRSGEVFPVEVNVAPLGAGSSRRYVGIFRDITERVNAERLLRQRQKMDSLGQLTTGLAHEYNNLLGIMMGHLDLLSEEFTSRPARESLEVIERTASRAASLTQRLLSFSRPVSASKDFVQVSEIVDHLDALLPRNNATQVELTIELPDNLWPCKVNREDFESALVSLANNAIEAMPAGGRILIEAENTTVKTPISAEQAMIPAGDYVQISIHDRGTGIPDHIRESIFEPFFTTKQNRKVAGLGLSNVFGFVTRSQGYVALESTVMKGTTIALFLPRANPRPQPGEMQKRDSLPLATGARALIVDDETDIGNFAGSVLSKAGYQTTVLSDARQAMSELGPDSKAYDLLITDIQMSGEIDGFQLAEYARRSHPDMKIIAITGSIRGRPVRNWQASSFDRILWKPFRKDDLIKIIEQDDRSRTQR